MAASPTLPLLFLALPAGALADLADRRRTMLVSQTIMAAAATAMAVAWFAGAATPPLLLAFGLLLGVGMAFTLPAWQALVPDLVPRDLVAGAVALNSAGFNVARAVGPALGGLVVASAGPGWAFLLNAITYLGVMAAVASFRGGAWHQASERSMLSAIALGIRYARFTAAFRWLLGVAAGFALTSAALQAMLPNLTEGALGGDAATYGLLLGSMGAGALAGAFTRQAAGDQLGRLMVPAAIAAYGVAGILVAASRTLAVTAVAMAAAGVAWVWTLASLNATAQLLAPAWVRGRVMSLYTLAFVGVLPLGAILAGAVGSLVGPPGAVASLSAAAVALGLAAVKLPLPALDEVRPPEPAPDYEPPRHPVTVEGGPVVVLTTWMIDERDLAAFLEVMSELRLVRLRTGAYRWRLYRNVGDPHRMTELFVLASWDEHLRQHRRLDRAAVEVIRRAQTFDRADGPVTAHLAAVGVADPARRPDWERLLAVHAELHDSDGSVPLQPPERDAVRDAGEAGPERPARAG